MKKKSILTLVLSLVLVGTISVGATLAYLTSTTDTKINTFTVGNVTISQDEPSWTSSSTNHNLVPGVVLQKDPTVTVVANSEDSWVFMKVEVPTELAGIVTLNYNIGTGDGKWSAVTGHASVYKYNTKVTKSTSDTVLNGGQQLFTTVTVSSAATNAQLKSLITNSTNTIKVSSFAIQANGLGTTTPENQLPTGW